MTRRPKLREFRSNLNKNLDLIMDKLLIEIARDLHDNLRERDEHNCDDYGNIYYSGSFHELYRRMGLIEEDSNAITSRFHKLYSEFRKDKFYSKFMR